MSEDEIALLEETAHDVLVAAVTAGVEAEALWSQLAELGFTGVGIDEDAGGSGGGLPEAAAVVRLVGYAAAPAPIGDSALLAAWLLEQGGFEIDPGLLASGAVDAGALTETASGWTLNTTLTRVPYARFATSFAVLAGEHVACVPASAVAILAGENLAGEPRDDVRFADVALGPLEVKRVPSEVTADRLHERGALVRALELAGALERVLALTVQHAGEREQFGRTIGSFQAIQQEIAIGAAEVASARAAVRAAVAAPTAFRIACAKVRTGEAAGRVAAIAHQVHGAIGYTEEHPLQRFTRRLWAWRDEFGSEEAWATVIGRRASTAGSGGLWALILGEGDQIDG
jgi:acyl-CoA dehydrogenase